MNKNKRYVSLHPPTIDHKKTGLSAGSFINVSHDARGGYCVRGAHDCYDVCNA